MKDEWGGGMLRESVPETRGPARQRQRRTPLYLPRKSASEQRRRLPRYWLCAADWQTQGGACITACPSGPRCAARRLQPETPAERAGAAGGQRTERQRRRHRRRAGTGNGEQGAGRTAREGTGGTLKPPPPKTLCRLLSRYAPRCLRRPPTPPHTRRPLSLLPRGETPH
ncbi:hypothetical protein MATL_G00183270 [Megalops atlanticus]|uniref:Uncharacterized protein n=1 Tax=Megalops atlanticus TaxID=7932 RepID=A0A9D3PMP4_MEGAT|nr:hypothetical protein MATL_G00183270 [Megalops atlanticus]